MQAPKATWEDLERYAQVEEIAGADGRVEEVRVLTGDLAFVVPIPEAMRQPTPKPAAPRDGRTRREAKPWHPWRRLIPDLILAMARDEPALGDLCREWQAAIDTPERVRAWGEEEAARIEIGAMIRAQIVEDREEDARRCPTCGAPESASWHWAARRSRRERRERQIAGAGASDESEREP